MVSAMVIAVTVVVVEADMVVDIVEDCLIRQMFIIDHRAHITKPWYIHGRYQKFNPAKKQKVSKSAEEVYT